MTAEIAIMNAQAVALAADSAVTFGSKVRNTANKIFALSKFEPIGVMIYNNAEFLGLPWETVIKTYRSSLGERAFSTLKEYADHFLAHIASDSVLRAATHDDTRIRAHIARVFVTIREHALRSVKQEIANSGSINSASIGEVIEKTVKSYDEKYRSSDQEIAKGRTFEVANHLANKTVKDVFGQLPLTDATRKMLVALSSFVVQQFPVGEYSGLVIAGFGRDELYPSLESYGFSTFADEAIVHTREEERCFEITATNRAVIVPFAQSEVVATLIDGVDPRYQKLIESLVSKILDEYPQQILSQVSSLPADEVSKLTDTFRKSSQLIAGNYLQQLQDLRQETFSGPITAVVQALPKDELAAMAESLVNLTSFKRKISLDAETVGGPIDVAVISKGDGLIWIKRKHYFEPRLNPQFFNLYYWRERNERKEEDHPPEE